MSFLLKQIRKRPGQSFRVPGPPGSKHGESAKFVLYCLVTAVTPHG